AADTIFDTFDLTLRKALLEWRQLGPAAVVATVDDLIAQVPGDADDETRKFLALRLARVASTCFAEGTTNLGNAILERCRRLASASRVALVLPSVIDIDLARLSPERRAALGAARATSDLTTSVASNRLATLAKAVAAVALASWATVYALTSRGAWS